MSQQRLFPTIAGQHGLATSFQLREAGWSADAIRHARDRTIQEVVPRVFASHRGPLTVEQRLVGAHLWAGEAAVLTGRVALDRHGLTVPSLGTCVVLVPSTRRARAISGVRTVRTTRPIQVAAHKDDVPLTSVARALCDAAALQDLTGTELRATALSALQRRLTHPDRVDDELRMRPATNLGPVRSALAEFADGVWSVPEGSLATLVRSDPTLPRYVLNPRLHAADGTLIGCPDGYFPTAGVVAQVHSKAFHSGVDEQGKDRWSATVEKDARYVEHGLVVVPVTPTSIARRPAQVLARIRAVVDAHEGRDLSHVRFTEGAGPPPPAARADTGARSEPGAARGRRGA